MDSEIKSAQAAGFTQKWSLAFITSSQQQERLHVELLKVLFIRTKQKQKQAVCGGPCM